VPSWTSGRSQAASHSNIALGGGNDLVRLLPGTHLRSAFINVAGPGLDFDSVGLDGVTVADKVQVSTGLAFDSVFVERSRIGDASGPPTGWWSTPAAAATSFASATRSRSRHPRGIDDPVLCVVRGGRRRPRHRRPDVHGQRVRLDGGGDDLIEMEHVGTTGSLKVLAGEGNNMVNLDEVTTDRDLIVLTGNGRDRMRLRQDRALGRFTVDLEGGDDFLDMVFLRSNVALSINGGSGFDSLSRFLNGSSPVETIGGFEQINGRPVLTAGTGGGVLSP